VYVGAQIPLPDDAPRVYLFPAFLEAMRLGHEIDFEKLLATITADQLQSSVDNKFETARYIALLEHLIIMHNDAVEAREEEAHKGLFY